jgi:diaminohydroxyphosphoribosylaminopyrimidine deaminase/5-amino-6-(5-phosphoribosylamino)uracil reductase
MDLALQQAALALALSAPNPRVGCVITAPDGSVLGSGHTQRAGQAHAEVMALRDAAARGHAAQGATAWVTLEPCCHQGRTGPCTDALISAGIARVVASLADPNPRVAGQGFERLRAAGIDVQIGPGAQASRELNIGFFSRMIRQQPWVRMKMAASLDGRSALLNGRSQWITSPEARADGHHWRSRASVVLTGIGTVLEDNPQLDVRLAPAPRQPDVVIVDSQLHTPPDARILQDGRKTLIYAAQIDGARQQALQARGAVIVCHPNAAGKVNLQALLRDLAEREVNEVHVEAGHKLNGSLIREGLVDEFLIYLAPSLIGQGREMALFGPITELSQAVGLQFESVERIGPDLRILARVKGRENF